jgi:hypothetical protein
MMDHWTVAILAIAAFGIFWLGYGIGRRERNNIREQFKRDLETFIDETEQRVGHAR